METGRAKSHLLAIIATQNEIVAAGLDPQAVKQRIADRARELTDADASVIELVEGEEMAYRVAAGTAVPFVGLRVPLDGSLSGECARSGEILLCADSESDARVNVEVCRHVGARSLACVPLRHRDAVVGVLKVYAGEAHRFDQSDVDTLDLLSGLAAAHMSHATRFAATEYESRHDVLTGLPNRRAYEARLGIEVAKSMRYDRPFSLCLMDLDGFKAVNDTFGHRAGDEVLKRVASIMETARGTDEVFRIGGDEFAWLMPETIAGEADQAAARIARSIADAGLGDGRITASYGIADAAHAGAAALHDAADAALYRAKRANTQLRAKTLP